MQEFEFEAAKIFTIVIWKTKEFWSWISGKSTMKMYDLDISYIVCPYSGILVNEVLWN